MFQPTRMVFNFDTGEKCTLEATNYFYNEEGTKLTVETSPGSPFPRHIINMSRVLFMSVNLSQLSPYLDRPYKSGF